MKVSYTCAPCGAHDVEVDVPARGTEDVIAWLEGVATPRLVADHRARSPHCGVGKFTHVKIPLAAGSDRIGEETKH